MMKKHWVGLLLRLVLGDNYGWFRIKCPSSGEGENL